MLTIFIAKMFASKSEYDQVMPQSNTEDQHIPLREEKTKHQ